MDPLGKVVLRFRGRCALWLALAVTLLVPAGVQSATGPVLLGDQAIETNPDSNSAGVAESFKAAATTTGTVGTLTVYVDTTSTATRLVVGIYTNANGHPGTLITQGSISSPTAGAWNDVPVPAGSVTAGTTYWISVLGPVGTLRFRDRRGAGASESSAQTGLTALPPSWSTGTVYSDGPISAYASGGAATQPILSVSPASLAFSASAGGSNPSPQSLSVANNGAGTLNFTDSTDASWLSSAPASGAAPATVQVSASVSGLAQGTYTGHVTVTAADAQGSPQTVPVTLSVSGPPPPPSGADWLMVDHDPQRTGFASGESALSTGTVPSLRQSWTAGLDGKITAQPLFASGVSVGGQTRDVVIAATAANSLYALDPADGHVLWRRNFGTQTNN
ncbi:MAG: hypothetical protein QOD66_3872, partial [Solirubrobacteraceae bacterium]|nr:hypothetical protein [Solirubrobacteraceae bacterium]